MIFHAILAFTSALLCIGLAVVVFFEDIRSFHHRTFASGMITLALVEMCAGMSAQALLPSDVLHWERLRLTGAAFLPGSWLLFSLSFARSNYRELLAKWKWFALGSFVLPLGLVTFFRHSLFAAQSTWEPSSVALIPLDWSGHLFYVFFLFMSVIILMNLEGTLRASAGSKRWRIKFMVLGLGCLFAVRIYTDSQTLLFSSPHLTIQSINSSAIILADLLIIVSLIRNRLWYADIYLSQAFLYNSLTVLVSGVYLLAVGVLAKVLSYVGLSEFFPLEAFFVFLSLVGLTAVLLSDQLRQTLRRFINRHLQRPHYDYRKEWRAFTQRTSFLLNSNQLCAAVSSMVSETFGVPSVTIWLADEGQGHVSLGGSTALSEAHARELISAENGAADLVRSVREQETAIDFVRPQDARGEKLKESNPHFLHKAQICYAVPLAAGRQFLGVMTLSGRLTKEPFSLEDFELLKTIADQTAASLLNLQLSGRLLRAKEMEAFHTLSAFCMHDLKNLAALLSLTLQNLPIHYDDPTFRKDMLCTMAQGVAKINAICTRLSLLSKSIELERTEADLNDLVTTTLATLNGSLKASLLQDLQPVSRLWMDSEQVQKVLVNLVLNASDAAGEHGEIRVATEEQDGWAVLSVSDNGCGISKAFMEESLFRPFHTTKSRGLGIGLFHSKMIVEAHRGRIEVDSEEGKGSTFRVKLPIARQ